MNINFLKTQSKRFFYKKMKKITTNFEHFDESYIINKAYLFMKLPKIEGQLSYKEKGYNEFKVHNNKQTVEETLIEKAVKPTPQILYDKGQLDNLDNSDEVLKECLLFRQVNRRSRPRLEEVFHNVIK